MLVTNLLRFLISFYLSMNIPFLIDAEKYCSPQWFIFRFPIVQTPFK